jgi:hypothetical protein
MFADTEDLEPDLIGELDLFHQIPNTLFSGNCGILGQVPKRV